MLGLAFVVLFEDSVLEPAAESEPDVDADLSLIHI